MRWILYPVLILLAIYVGISRGFINQVVVKEDVNLEPYGALMASGANLHETDIRLVDSEYGFYCSGVVIDANYALTAAHCVTDELGNLSTRAINIYDEKDKDTGTVAVAVAAERLRDVAFIKGNFSNFKQNATDFEGKLITDGMTMVSCGYPSGQYFKFCIELKHIGNSYFRYRTQGGPIFKGMSGGGVRDKTGVVIGVNSAVDNDNVIIAPLVGVLESLGIQ